MSSDIFSPYVLFVCYLSQALTNTKKKVVYKRHGTENIGQWLSNILLQTSSICMHTQFIPKMDVNCILVLPYKPLSCEQTVFPMHGHAVS